MTTIKKIFMVPNPFTPGKVLKTDPEICNGCNFCVEQCRSDVMMPNPTKGKAPII